MGVAVGQPLEDVEAPRECREIHFVLHDLRSITLKQMLHKMVSDPEKFHSCH